MAMNREFTLPSTDGSTTLYAAEWQPTVPVRGIVQLVHGIAEHIGRYDAFASFLAEQGYLVVGNDHLGHGKSAADKEQLGSCGEADGWNKMVSDLHTLHEMTRAQYPNVPYFLFGHSMGSFLSRTYIARYHTDLDGVILCGTGHQSRLLVRFSKLLIGRQLRKNGAAHRSETLHKLAFGKYNAGIEAVSTPNDWLSRDKEAVARYEEDELCGHFPTTSLFAALSDGISFITDPKNILAINKDLPILFLSGDRDPVGEYGKGVTRAYQAFRSAGLREVSLKLYPGARHELINETNWEEVFQDVLLWLNAH